jgi:polyisoprenoid-binding protein YceI
VGGAVVAAAGLFAAAYLLFFTPDSPPPLTLTDDDPVVGSTVAGAAGTPSQAVDGGQVAGVWRVASGSEAGYRVREKLAALPASSDAVGRTTSLTGEVRLEEAASGIQVSSARFEADLRQLRSDEGRRDSRIRTQGLESDRFPMATFVTTAPIAVPGQPGDGQDVSLTAVGDLTIHGVTRSVTIPVEGRLSGDRIQLVGALTFPMSDFDITPPSIGGFVTVEPEATMEFRLFLEKA